MIHEKNVKKYCCEDISLIENYDKAIADNSQVWNCHHRREVQDGFTIWRKQELKAIGQYYDRPASELIFITKSEHMRLHRKSEKHDRIAKIITHNNMSNALKNKTHSEFGMKFFEHFGKHRLDDLTLYNTEINWYNRHGKCRWE